MKTIQYKVYDKEGKLRKLIDKNKEKQLDENEWLNGVTCFVINEKGEVLIEKRVNKGLTPGKLDLCSGHVDGEETQTQAMIRELREELGIQLEESINVTKITSDGVPLQFESSGKLKNFFITFYCLRRNSSDVIFQKSEIDKIVWLPLEETFELIKSGRTKFPKNYNYKEIFEKVRKKRTGEVDGIDKEFVSEEEFEKLKKEKQIVVDFEFLGAKYAYRKADLTSNANQVTEVHYNTIYNFKNNATNVFAIYIIPKDLERAKQELKNRNLAEEVEKDRLKEIDEHVKEYEQNKDLQNQFDYVFINDYTEKSKNDLLKIIKERIDR